jgi:hypothetical protein
MKKKYSTLVSFILICPFFFLPSQSSLHAQCDTIAKVCSKNMQSPYLSDGQQYRALLLADQTAEFHATFFGGSTYRIAACSGLKDGSLLFSLYDEKRNLLYSNKEYQSAPYWDFKINSTLNVILEASLPTGATSSCAVVLIGFKQ